MAQPLEILLSFIPIGFSGRNDSDALLGALTMHYKQDI